MTVNIILLYREGGRGVCDSKEPNLITDEHSVFGMGKYRNCFRNRLVHLLLKTTPSITILDIFCQRKTSEIT